MKLPASYFQTAVLKVKSEDLYFRKMHAVLLFKFRRNWPIQKERKKKKRAFFFHNCDPTLLKLLNLELSSEYLAGLLLRTQTLVSLVFPVSSS